MPFCVVLLAVLLAACGGSEEPLPTACRADGPTIERALRAAPDVVRLEGTPLSECVRLSTSDADLLAIGGTLTALGDRLALQAAEGDRRAALELGYVAGATERGSRTTSGIHAELAYRLERSAARAVGSSPGIDAELQRGIAAGAARG